MFLGHGSWTTGSVQERKDRKNTHSEGTFL